uniref:Uncharacterized protein n=1 Tax=Cacopsylla melanoneura TaxID=428564 RepID=A0A8D9EAJ6_9HEMI
MYCIAIVRINMWYCNKYIVNLMRITKYLLTSNNTEYVNDIFNFMFSICSSFSLLTFYNKAQSNMMALKSVALKMTINDIEYAIDRYYTYLYLAPNKTHWGMLLLKILTFY